MSNLAGKQRVIVYIDGYNLYHGRQAAFGDQYKWLDLQAFSESFLKPGMELTAVKYFTAISRISSDSRQRQDIYLKALQAHCDRVNVIYGRFQSKSKYCRYCGAKHETFEEKKTDVNIACEILNDTHLDRFDCCYVVSGDSDLVPPLKIIRQNHPKKRTFVANPPKRKSAELCKIANGWFIISKPKLKNNQLPQEVDSTNNGVLIRPTNWI